MYVPLGPAVKISKTTVYVRAKATLTRPLDTWSTIVYLHCASTVDVKSFQAYDHQSGSDGNWTTELAVANDHQRLLNDRIFIKDLVMANVHQRLLEVNVFLEKC